MNEVLRKRRPRSIIARDIGASFRKRYDDVVLPKREFIADFLKLQKTLLSAYTSAAKTIKKDRETFNNWLNKARVDIYGPGVVVPSPWSVVHMTPSDDYQRAASQQEGLDKTEHLRSASLLFWVDKGFFYNTWLRLNGTAEQRVSLDELRIAFEKILGYVEEVVSDEPKQQ
jgi:hypothetical protein